MDKIINLIDGFYDDIVIEYGEYHNKITSPSLIGATLKKVDSKEVIDKYTVLLYELEGMIKEVSVL